ncbi:MAG: hypothetical protein RL375_2417 [Pseudomonadota bacterium]
MTAPDDITPGLLVLHGNRLEALRDAVFAWLALRPLAPLEQEVLLVQSNGAAEWLKMAQASSTGLCTATRVELPARFLWRSYRQMLGEVPMQSALDKDALTWRLMRLLPTLAGAAGFEPIAGFLQGGEADRRLQLAERLADLYDQYQVYRADWLSAWEQGRDELAGPDGANTALPADQRWQALLWRAVLAELDAGQRAATRPEVHREFVAALLRGDAPVHSLPRRVVLFGAAHVPAQTLEALAALAQRCQVILAIPNPCRFHWADIIEGRELLRQVRSRHRARNDVALIGIGYEAMHQHAHPLLAAWGRQGRDFMRQLDAFDDAEAARQRFRLPDGELPRIDLFDHEADAAADAVVPAPLLLQVQRAVRDLLPLADHPHAEVALADRSIVFHIAHSAQREVEVLHDQLLQLLAHPPQGGAGGALEPRDIVVMVPDVELFAPAIRAVFGQVGREDARFIPFEIADLRQRGHNPLVLALEWLLRAPTQRFRLAELKDLFDVPALARRLGVDDTQRPQLAAWMQGAGIRWGLHERQRAGLGLQACGEQNTALFGLRRLLLGYASGSAGAWGGPDGEVWPYDEVGGLDAAVVGALADLVDRLSAWVAEAAMPATPAVWAERGRALLDAFFDPSDERERLTLAALRSGLAAWLDACEAAEFVEPVPVEVLREAWLDGVDAPGSGRRFLAGGVTFCTLMPLRAVPFEVVCLLGMNDGDYPRATHRSDFDLLGLPGQARPGDRSRRDDDRYLMLEALLSARRVLYVSWAGRSARDNSEQPPSVLVAQLRDYLAAGWRAAGDPSGEPPSAEAAHRLLHQLSTEHPLQPFSRRYFENALPEKGDLPVGQLLTYAREWRAAHAPLADLTPDAVLPAGEADAAPITLQQLTRFLKNPVKEFFKARLHVVFPENELAVDDDEAFALAGLDDWALLAELTADPQTIASPAAVPALVQARLARVRGSGRLPMAGLGQRVVDDLAQTAVPMLLQWQQLHARYDQPVNPLSLRAEHAGVVLEDWLDGLRSDGITTVWISSSASRLMTKPTKSGKRDPRHDKLVDAWLRLVVASACAGPDDPPMQAILLGRDACLQLAAPAQDDALAVLRHLLPAWCDGMAEPLPFVCKTAIAQVLQEREVETYEGSDFGGGLGDVREPCLARVYADYDTLTADGRSLRYAELLFGPLLSWAADHVTELPWAEAPALHETGDDDAGDSHD